MGSRWEANGIMTEDEDFVSVEGDWTMVVGVEEGVLHRLEFLERGVEAPLSRRRSKLVPLFATCDRDFSGDSKTLGA